MDRLVVTKRCLVSFNLEISKKYNINYQGLDCTNNNTKSRYDFFYTLRPYNINTRVGGNYSGNLKIIKWKKKS